jgi:hypothetical protein
VPAIDKNQLFPCRQYMAMLRFAFGFSDTPDTETKSMIPAHIQQAIENGEFQEVEQAILEDSDNKLLVALQHGFDIPCLDNEWHAGRTLLPLYRQVLDLPREEGLSETELLSLIRNKSDRRG